MAEADAAAGTKKAATAALATAKNAPPPKTKRQKLKDTGKNKNVWPQFPKLQGVERRDNAYLRAAGLLLQKKNDDSNSSKDDMLFQHLGRALGGPDSVMRHKAILRLEQYLKGRCESTGLSELDLLKLSKCLWYTLYMADRQVVQTELSKIISKLVVETLAGTEEEDEYAAALYLRACEAEEEDADKDEESDVDEEAFPVEEADSDEENVDFLAKQMDLLEDEEEGEDSDDIEECSDCADEQHDTDQITDQQMEDPSGYDDVDHDEEECHDNGNEDDDNDNDTNNEDPVNAPHGRGAHLSALFFRTFLRTILQNWAQMDKYRIDKFYTMLRFLMERMYSYCASRGWNSGMIRLFNDGLCDEVLAKVPNGVRCHLIDVCLDELVKYQEDVTEAVFLDVVQPFFSMAQTGVDGDDLVHIRAVENVMNRFLDKYSVFAEGQGNDDGPRFYQVHVGTVAQFIFELASDEMTLQRYRPRLYEVYKKYTKCIRLNGEEHDVDISRMDISLEEEDDEEKASLNIEEDDEDDRVSTPVVEVVKEVVEEPKPKISVKNTQTVTTVKDSQTVTTEVVEQRDNREADIASKTKKKRKKKRSDETYLSSFNGKPQQETVISGEWMSKIQSQIKEKVAKLHTENEIVISVEEQRNAKAMMKKDGATRKRQREHQDGTLGESEKKVKFGDKNRAKSHKASMKALKQASPPSGVKPDRGILRNKDAKIALKKGVMKKTKGRRRG